MENWQSKKKSCQFHEATIVHIALFQATLQALEVAGYSEVTLIRSPGKSVSCPSLRAWNATTTFATMGLVRLVTSPCVGVGCEMGVGCGVGVVSRGELCEHGGAIS